MSIRERFFITAVNGTLMHGDPRGSALIFVPYSSPSSSLSVRLL